MATMRAEVTLQEKVRWSAEAGSGHSLIIDGPPDEGGQNAGFRPMELMLLGLGGCIGSSTLSILRRMRQEVTGYKIKLVGERAAEPPSVYTAVTIEHEITGKGISEDSVRRALDLVESKYCSAWAMFAKTARLSNSYRIVEECTR